jgi:hypothetical protein
MLENLFGGGTLSRVGEMMYWAWANNHPYLFTIIKVLQTSPLLVVFYILLKIVQVIFKRG